MPDPRLILERVVIRRLRGFHPDTDLRFHSDLTVLLGQNGTGKTTLLQLIEAICAQDFRIFADTAIDIEFHSRIGELKISCSLKTDGPLRKRSRRSHTRNQMPLELPGLVQEDWQYTVDVHRANKQKNARFSAKPGTAVVINGDKTPRPAPSTSPFADSSFVTRAVLACVPDAPHLLSELSALIEVERNCMRFDEALGVYEAIVQSPWRQSDCRLSASLARYKEPKGHFWSGKFVPKELLSTDILEEHGKGSSHALLPRISLDSGKLSFLKNAVESMGMRKARMTLRAQRTSPDDDSAVIVFNRFNFEFQYADGGAFLDSELSFGQKRLLSFFYYTAANHSTVIADELVNGLHHSWIESCLNRLEGRQAFMSSQNPLLLDFMAVETQQEAEDRFIVCGLANAGGRQRHAPRNMNAKEARRLHEGITIGIQQVSAILQDLRLW